tara:strand:+ start:1365 stop:1571 length:207 start_codon:yes stop_codon:yes gene_type:complete
MIDSERLELDFEDVLCGATEQFTGLEIYDALNKAINKQMAWHQNELKALQEFQWLVTGAAPGDPSDLP